QSAPTHPHLSYTTPFRAISLRRGDHPMGGNRFAGARFAAPAGERDPAERIRLIHDFVLTARAEPALDALGLAAPAMNRLPTPLRSEEHTSELPSPGRLVC